MDLESKIKYIIYKQGPIAVSEFVEEVLANQQYGYYSTKNSIGNDFITSPEISQLFGEMIGVWCFDIWQKLRCPNKIALIELGPGKGTLIGDILRSTKHIAKFHHALDLHFVEISQKLQNIQYENIKHYDIPKYWYKSIAEISLNIPSIVIGNEFFDALPIDQYMLSKGSWYKRFIRLNDKDHYEFIDIITSLKETSDLNLEFGKLEDGSIIEISKKSIEYMTNIARMVKYNSGAALIIDYGYFMENNIATKTYSTLQAVKDHKYHHILSDIGQADISAHVDFHKLSEVVKLYNLEHYICSQRDFLTNLGINIRAAILARNCDDLQKKNIYQNLDRLIAYDKMGELFKALVISNYLAV